MRLYTIRKNTHSSKFLGFLPHFGFTFKKNIEKNIIFDNSCLYDLKDIDNWDANKLFGVSTSWNHMIQSARIGWRCLDNENIEILTFVHENHHFLEAQVLGSVKPGEKFNAKITVEDYKFIFNFKKGDIQNLIEISKKEKSWKFKYKLYFYFGGNEPAPHNMKVYLA